MTSWHLIKYILVLTLLDFYDKIPEDVFKQNCFFYAFAKDHVSSIAKQTENNINPADSNSTALDVI